MNELIKIGKKKTILLSISILIVSIHTIYFYHVVQPEIDIKKFAQQAIRFTLTIGLLIMVYKGKKWAKILLLILFAISIIVAVAALAALSNQPFMSKLPIIVMTIVYSIAGYHFGFSKSYKAFFEYQNKKDKE